MGAQASKDKVQGPLVVMIVLGGGKKETYSRPVSAQEVMLRHRQHVLTRRSVMRRSYTIVTPETVLLPGNKYYLVQRRTVEWLLDDHVDLAKMSSNLNDSSSCKSGSGIDPLNLGSGATTFTYGIASPWRSQAIVDQKLEQLWASRGRTRVKSPLESPLKSPLKSPLDITRSIEDSPRSWRSSPKVCPGGDECLWDEQISDICKYMYSPVNEEKIWKLETMMNDGRSFPSPMEDAYQLKLMDEKRKKVDHAHGNSGSVETSGHVTLTNCLLQLPLLPEDQTSDAIKEKSSPLLSRSTSMQDELLSKQEAPACNSLSQSPALVVANNVNSALQGEEGVPRYQRCLSLPDPTEVPKNKPLFQLLKYPDLNITELVEDTQQCIPPLALKVDSEVHESNKQNNPDLPEVEPVEGNDRIGVMPEEEERSSSDDVSCLHQDDEQHKESQSHVIQEPHSHVDLGALIIDNIHNIAHTSDDEKGWKDNTLPENTQISELGSLIATCNDEATKASLQRNEGSTLSESLLPNIVYIDLENVVEDQQQEGCAYTPPENTFDQPTSNLMLSFNEKSGQLCQSGEEDASVQVCQPTHGSKAIDVDGSNNKKSCKDINKQLVPTLGDVLLGQSPNHLELIDSGIRQGEKTVCCMSDVSSLSLSSSLPSSPSSSSSLSLSSSVLSLSASSSSLHVSGSSSLSTSSRSYLSPSMSSSLSASSSVKSPLSLLMRLDRPKTMFGQPQQVNNYAKAQRNLAVLGFSSIGSDIVSIYEQATAHKRAHLGKQWKVASSKRSSSVEQEQERVHSSKQQRVEKEAWQPFIFAPRSPTISHCRSFHFKIRRSLLQPPKKPLSPILEVSPELSPASLSPLSDCSS